MAPAKPLAVVRSASFDLIMRTTLAVGMSRSLMACLSVSFSACSMLIAPPLRHPRKFPWPSEGSLRSGGGSIRTQEVCLRKPEPHVHVAQHGPCGSEVITGHLVPSRALAKFAERQMGPRLKRAHPQAIADGQALAKRVLGPCAVDRLLVSGDVSQQEKRVGLGALLAVSSRDLQGTAGETRRVLDPARPQMGVALPGQPEGVSRHESRGGGLPDGAVEHGQRVVQAS